LRWPSAWTPFLALRKPELQALLPDDFDGDFVRIHRGTKTGNDERLPVIAPLKRLLADGWEQINLQKARRAIQKRIQGTNLRWLGWYAFRRGWPQTSLNSASGRRKQR
jgi:hypothetical protein